MLKIRRNDKSFQSKIKLPYTTHRTSFIQKQYFTLHIGRVLNSFPFVTVGKSSKNRTFEIS